MGVLKRLFSAQETNIVTRTTAALVGQSKTDLVKNGLSVASIILLLVLIGAGIWYFIWKRQATVPDENDIEEGVEPPASSYYDPSSYRSNLGLSGQSVQSMSDGFSRSRSKHSSRSKSGRSSRSKSRGSGRSKSGGSRRSRESGMRTPSVLPGSLTATEEFSPMTYSGNNNLRVPGN